MRGLDELLAGLDCRALIVVGRSSRDPFLGPFAGAGAVHDCLLVAPRGARPRLAYLAPIDRLEAEATGLELLSPADLDVARWMREGRSDGERWAHVVSRALHLCELAPGRLAWAGLLSAGHAVEIAALLAEEGWRFAAGEDLVATLRKHKTENELADVRAAAAGARAALGRVAELLAHATVRQDAARGGALELEGETLKVGRLRRAVAAVLAEHGLEQPHGNLIGADRDAAVPHTAGDDQRPVRPQASLVVDVFPRRRLFADTTRTFCVGEPPEALRRAHAEVEAALRLARSRVAPGVRAWSVQEAVCERFTAAGWPTAASDPSTTRGYVHGLGHGVGWELHEYPSFKENAGEAEGRLDVGDVFTLEPGLYEPGEGWGVRLEDTVVLGQGGAEVLTDLPYDLDPRAWREAAS